METIIAIMLYLQLVNAPGTYFQTELDQLRLNHKPQIDHIMNDPGKMDLIHTEYDDDVCKITIIDDSRSGSIEDAKKNKKIKNTKPAEHPGTKQTHPNKDEETMSEA